jgi:hypothetical protein
MEHLVRVQNERDRRALAWLRARKPYLSAVCRTLGVTAPRFGALAPAPSAAAE